MEVDQVRWSRYGSPHQPSVDSPDADGCLKAIHRLVIFLMDVEQQAETDLQIRINLIGLQLQQ